jgi:hypothetical protein
MASEEIDFVMDHLRRLAEPNTALVITQNEEGEIIDARVVDVTEALFILRMGKLDERKEDKQETPGTSESSWWAPST